MPANVETMAYFGEVPWHGLGTKLEHVAIASSAIVAAHLDWEVGLRPIYVSGREVSQFQAIERTKDGEIYGVVRKRYTPVQNREAFGFFDSVVGTGEAMYHTAGALGKGARVWILAKLNGSISIKGDEVEKYLLLTNGHDGFHALEMFWTPIRVVCQNTLQAALAGKGSKMFYARHTIRIGSKIEAARDILGLSEVYYQRFAELGNKLASQSMTQKQLDGMVNFVFRASEAPEDAVPMEQLYQPRELVPVKMRAPKLQAMQEVKRLFEVGKGNDAPEIKGTRWAAYNSVVEFADYVKGTRSKKEGARLDSVWFGSGMEMKNRALEYLTKSG